MRCATDARPLRRCGPAFCVAAKGRPFRHHRVALVQAPPIRSTLLARPAKPRTTTHHARLGPAIQSPNTPRRVFFFFLHSFVSRTSASSPVLPSILPQPPLSLHRRHCSWFNSSPPLPADEPHPFPRRPSYISQLSPPWYAPPVPLHSRLPPLPTNLAADQSLFSLLLGYLKTSQGQVLSQCSARSFRRRQRQTEKGHLRSQQEKGNRRLRPDPAEQGLQRCHQRQPQEAIRGR